MKHIHGGNFDILCQTKELHNEVLKQFVFPETSNYRVISSNWQYEEKHLLSIVNGKYDGFLETDGLNKKIRADEFLKLYTGSSESTEQISDDVLLLL